LGKDFVTQALSPMVYIRLDRITHNMSLLLALVGDHPLWPAIKANAYGHGSEIFAWHLIGLGYKTLCVAHLAEAVELVDKGIEAQFIILSPTLAENSAYLDADRPGIYTYGLKPYSIC
jgi:alanine racemase